MRHPRPGRAMPLAGRRAWPVLLALLLALALAPRAGAATWTKQEVIANSIENSTQTNAHISAAVDSAGTPYLAWRTGANTAADGIRIAKKGAGGWSLLTSFTGAQLGALGLGALQDDTSIKIDGSGNVHLAFRALATPITASSKRGVVYGKYNGTAWTFEEVETATDPNAFKGTDDPSLALDGAGVPSIAFASYNLNSPRTYALKFATRATGAWAVSTLDQAVSPPDPIPPGNGSQDVTEPSLALDAAGKAHISYMRNTGGTNNDDNLRYATNASGAWVLTTLSTGSATNHPGEPSALALDPAGKVHIAFREGVNADLLYATNATGAWVTSLVDGDGVTGSTAIALSINGAGNALLAYSVQNANFDLAVKAASRASGGAWAIDTVDATPDSGRLQLGAVINGANRLTIGYEFNSPVDNTRKAMVAEATLPGAADATPPGTSITGGQPANPSNSAAASFIFTGTDDVTPAGSLTFECKLDAGSFAACTSPQAYSGLAQGSHTFQVRAKDAAGNVDASPASYTWTVDTAPPDTSITGGQPANPTSQTGASFTFSGADGTGSGVAGFECRLDAGSFAACTSPQAYSGLAQGSHTFQVRARDAAGNVDASPASHTWTVDTSPPAVTVPANMTVEAAGPAGRAVTYTASATDVNPASPAVSCTPASGSTFALGATSVTCSATDAAGNTASQSFTVTVVDTTAPTLSGTPGNQTVEATGAAGAVVSYTAPTANDLVDGAITPTCTPASGGTFALGTTTVTCSAADTRGNNASTSFTVTVQDTTAPTLSGTPGNMAVEATGAAGAAVTYTAPTASDLVDGALTPTCAPASGSTFALGATAVTCSATDAAGNTASTSFTVTVADTTAPTLSGTPGNQTVEATGASGAAVTYTAPMASDLVDGAVTPTCAPASGSTFALGVTSVTCSATDAAGNTAGTSFTITIQDTTPPTLSGTPGNLTVEATGPAGAAVSYTAPTANDLVSGPVTVTCSPASGATFALGDTTVTCAATDAAGNAGSAGFTITVQDTTPPTLTGTPGNMTVEATSPAGAVVSYTAPTAADTVDGSRPVDCSPAAGGTFAAGTTMVTCSASDTRGNSAASTFTVTVADTTPPAVTVPASMTEEATGPAGRAVTYTASATDINPASPAVSCSPASGATFALGATTVTCAATDAAGNTGSSSFTVTVRDTTPPAIVGRPGDITLPATGPGGAAASWAAPTAVDAVDGARPVVCSPASGSTFPRGATTVSCAASDSRGNAAGASFLVTVGDPVLTVPATAGGGATGGGSYPGGGVATLTATPAPGYIFLGWTVDGRFAGWANPLTVTMAGNHTVVPSFAPRPSFRDVAAGDASAEAIAQLAARGILRGYPDGRFGPEDTTLRAQMAAMIARAMGWDREEHGNTFSDRGTVDAELWRNVGALAFYNVARGYQDGTYRPTNPVLYAQVISFITRAMVAQGYWVQQADDPRLYPNVPAASGHRADIATFIAYVGGIPGAGPTEQNWAPWGAPSTRGWHAEVLWRALDSYWGVDRVP